MGKFESNQKKSAKRKTSPRLRHLLLAAVVLVLVLLLAFLIRLIPVLERTQLPEITGTVPGTAPSEQPGIWTEPEVEEEPVLLQDGLQIRCVSRYAGIYMEDGSDEIVSDVMMLILENTSQSDLQLARIEIAYSGFTAEFEATNLPAGESVVLLEKNRHAAVSEEYQFLEAKMSCFSRNP